MPVNAAIFAEIYQVACAILTSIDAGDVDAALAHMSDGVVISVGEQAAQGQAAVRAAIADALNQGGTSRHLLSNLRVSAEGDGALRVLSDVLVISVRPSGQTITVCEYRDRFVTTWQGFQLAKREMAVICSITAAD